VQRSFGASVGIDAGACGNVARIEASPCAHRGAMNVRVVRWLKVILVIVGSLAGLFGLMQLIPYGRTHSNPDIIEEPKWDSPRTRELAKRACFDCHSNETRWPWYANVAPMSWVVEFDVEAARDVINFSEWNRTYPLAPHSGESVINGGMPTMKYRMAHPEADLTHEETVELARGLDATLKVPSKNQPP
jgi:hypothetical protein